VVVKDRSGELSWMPGAEQARKGENVKEDRKKKGDGFWGFK